MSRMKTFFKYAMWLILFFIFTDFLIAVGLNANYKNIKRRDNNTQIEITEAQATLVSGKMKGTIKSTEESNLAGKYLKIDLYSKRDILVGRKYIEIETTNEMLTQKFQIYFELQDVASYELTIVDEKEEDKIKLLPEDMTRGEIIVATIFTLLIFW